MKMYIGGEYLEKNPTWDIEDSPWKSKQIIKIIERNNLHPNSICEVGCGAGEILNQLYLKMPSNIRFTGYEISPQAFKLCEQRKKRRLQFYLKDLFQDSNAYFDVILIIDVIEHIEDYFGFLRNIHKKSQYKIFHIPLDLSVQTVLRNHPILNAREEVGHIHYFTKEMALATLKDTDYEIIDYFYTAGSIDLPAKYFKTLLVRLSRKIAYKLNSNIAVRVLGGYSLMVLAD